MKFLLCFLLVAFVVSENVVNVNFQNMFAGGGPVPVPAGTCPQCPTCPQCSSCQFSVPVALNIFGAKPPRYLLGNITRDYYARQQPNFKVFINYRPVDVPETVSGDGIEVLLRGFGDIASSGRYVEPADFTARGCNGSFVQADGSSSGPCNGRVMMNIGFVNDHIFFGVHPTNPITDLTTAQLSKITNAILGGGSITWSEAFPGVQFPADLASAKVNFLNGPPGGGIPQSVDTLTGIRTNSITPLPSSTISSVRASTKNWLSFFVMASPPSPTAVKAITWNGQDAKSNDYSISHTFNAIIDVKNPNAAAVTDYLCYVLDYKFDGKLFNLFPLSDQQRASEKTKLGCH